MLRILCPKISDLYRSRGKVSRILFTLELMRSRDLENIGNNVIWFNKSHIMISCIDPHMNMSLSEFLSLRKNLTHSIKRCSISRFVVRRYWRIFDSYTANPISFLITTLATCYQNRYRTLSKIIIPVNCFLVVRKMLWICLKVVKKLLGSPV